MPLERLDTSARLRLRRGSVAVAIPVFDAFDVFTQCIHSVLRHTDRSIPVLVADDASLDPAILRFLEDLSAAGRLERRMSYMRQSENVGFVRNCNTVFDVLGDADVVLLNSDCVVGAGWLESLRAAAESDSLVATATPLTNNGTILSVPLRNRPQPALPQEWAFDAAADAVRRASPRLRPRIPTSIGHCVYVRRSALDLVGNFDEAFSPGYGEEVDFSQRCILTGLQHVVADDVLVLHHGSASFANSELKKPTVQSSNDRLVAKRYRYYEPWIESMKWDETEPLSRSLRAVSTALAGLSVTVDGRALTKHVTGTQLYTLELIAALSRQQDLQLRVIVPPDIGDYARAALMYLSVDNVVTTASVANGGHGKTHVVHRPCQVSSWEDLDLLDSLGERLVISHLDVIAFENPGYHQDFKAWWSFRRLTKVSLALAERVIFISRHAARSAVTNGIVDPERASVSYLGTDHTLPAVVDRARRPEALAARGDDRPFLLCLGTDFRHKNRRFAYQLMTELRERHGWSGALVLAGPHVSTGSSLGGEAEYLALHSDLEGSVFELGAVDEEEKLWLYRRATALLYPSIYEGFGLPPMEAAEAGTPCLFAPQTALAEMFPRRLAMLVPWDARASADRIIGILDRPDERGRFVRDMRLVSARFTWERTGREVRAVYEQVVAGPPSEQGLLRSELEVARASIRADMKAVDEKRTLLEEYEKKRHILDAFEGFDRYDRMLVGPNGSMPPELRRAMLRIGDSRVLRGLFFKPMIGAYRFGFLAKNRKRASRSARRKVGSAQ